MNTNAMNYILVSLPYSVMIIVMTLPMFERAPDMKLTVGSVSGYPTNLSVSYMEGRNHTYACVVQKSQVHTVNWDLKHENVNWDSVQISDLNSEKPISVLQKDRQSKIYKDTLDHQKLFQAALIHPSIRTHPLLVVATTAGVQIFDIRTHKLLLQQILDSSLEGDVDDEASVWNMFCRGITCNDNIILVGTCYGFIMQFICNGESSISVRKNLKEHTVAIADLATCRYDDITCSADSAGTIIVWQKPVKGVDVKIATQLVFAHSRPVTCISVAADSAYVLTGGEDGRFIVYKLHTRKPQAYQVEYRYSDELPHSAIMGAQFTNGRGSHIAISCYDHCAIQMYRIIKKPSQT
uniref:WD_REPEATS_REGION domain-containing protein n=1 Tax=Heterorhabditis bacteriophora TaxID=37862 RepID=A0A1I7WGJ6_HETBA